MMIATSSVRLLARGLSLAGALAVSACAVGPKYVRPAVEIPPAFKEVVPDAAPSADGWKPAQPGDNVTRGVWWMLFNDPTLNALEVQLNAGNQSIAAAMEAFMAARALTRQARSPFTRPVIGNRSSCD